MKTFIRICAFFAVFFAARIVFTALPSGSGVAEGDILAKLVRIDGLQFAGRTISGQLANLGSSRFDTVSLRFVTYTRDGAKLGEASDGVARLDGRERWAFRAYAGSEVGTYALTELRVNGMRVPVGGVEVHYAGEASIDTAEVTEKKKAIVAAERERADEGRRMEAAAVAYAAKQEAEIKAGKRAKLDAAVQAFREEQKWKASKETQP